MVVGSVIYRSMRLLLGAARAWGHRTGHDRLRRRARAVVRSSTCATSTTTLRRVAVQRTHSSTSNVRRAALPSVGQYVASAAPARAPRAPHPRDAARRRGQRCDVLRTPAPMNGSRHPPHRAGPVGRDGSS